MKSHEEFQHQFSSVMENLVHTAVSETIKLFDKTVLEMKAELTRIRKQNDVLKDNLFADDIQSPTCKGGHCKRDIGVQCDAGPTRVERSCSPLDHGDPTTVPPGVLQDGNQQFALVFVKKEESDTYDETQTCLFARISEDQPKQLLVQHAEAPLLSQEANLIPVRLAAYQGASERPMVSLTRLSSAELSAAQKGLLTLTQQPSTNAADGSASARSEQLLVPKAEPDESDVDVESVDSHQNSDHLRRTSSRQTASKYRRVVENETSPASANNTEQLNHTQTKAPKDTAADKTAKAVDKIPKQPGKKLAGKTHKHKNQCDVCDRILSSATSLECHRRIHSGERPWVCERCGKGFPDGRGLRRHLLIHNPKRHQCTDCGKSFVYVFQLRNHQVIHTNEMEYDCKVCGKRFKSKSTRATHMHLHTGEKPFTCTVCSKKFRHRMSYNTHMQRHRGEKRYVCLTCKKPFADPNNLKAHKRVHTGERPYKCNVCEKRFKQSAHLKKHIATQH
ncbi:hypothetical protein ACEWY4_006102 [Coilia grayii]|uniref:C2H2-type domain-containing protein n=1 Tax=Coilia grayii TaxID=363190 RepID=A0ABD1KCH8_9TELE